MTARLISRIAGAPWAITAPALETILEVAAREPVDHQTLDAWKQHMAPERAALAARPGVDLPGTRRAQLRDGVAILGVRGPIFRHANLMTDVSGATALATLATDLTIARDDPRVKAGLLDIDSPGGETTGMTEAAHAIRAFAQVKPLVAFSEGSAASLAYLLGVSAGELVVAPDAIVGSLGIVAAVTDRREADARAGVRRHEIVSTQTPGKRPDPSTAEGYAAMQSLTDRLAEEFLGLVASMRGMDVQELLAATKGGGLVVGADAVAAGLADSVGGFEETLARLARGDVPLAKPVQSPGVALRPKAQSQETTDMTSPAPAPLADAAPQPPAPAAPPAPPQAAASPVAPPAPPADPVAVERTRAAAIQTAMKPGFSQLAGIAIAQGWSVETFAAAQDASAAAVAEATRGAQAQAFADSMPPPVAGSGEPADPSSLPLDQRAKADWDKDAKLRAEFGGDFASYLAFAKAEGNKVVKLISRA